MLNGWETRNKEHKKSPNEVPACGIPYGPGVFDVYTGKLHDLLRVNQPFEVRRSQPDAARSYPTESPAKQDGAQDAHMRGRPLGIIDPLFGNETWL